MREVVARTRGDDSLRTMSHTKPVMATAPKMVPAVTAPTWYMCSLTPNASVTDAGTSRPTKCPPRTASRPTWNMRMAGRNCRCSSNWVERVPHVNRSRR